MSSTGNRSKTPAKKPYRVSTHDLVRHPAAAARRLLLYSGVTSNWLRAASPSYGHLSAAKPRKVAAR